MRCELARIQQFLKGLGQTHLDSMDGICRCAAGPSTLLEPSRTALPPHTCTENRLDGSGSYYPGAAKPLSDRALSRAGGQFAKVTSPRRGPRLGRGRRPRVTLDEKDGIRCCQSDCTSPYESVTGLSRRSPIRAQSGPYAVVPTHASVSLHGCAGPHYQCGGSRKNRSGYREDDSPECTVQQCGRYKFCPCGGPPGTGCFPEPECVFSRRSISERLSEPSVANSK